MDDVCALLPERATRDEPAQAHGRARRLGTSGPGSRSFTPPRLKPPYNSSVVLSFSTNEKARRASIFPRSSLELSERRRVVVCIERRPPTSGQDHVRLSRADVHGGVDERVVAGGARGVHLAAGCTLRRRAYSNYHIQRFNDSNRIFNDSTTPIVFSTIQRFDD